LRLARAIPSTHHWPLDHPGGRMQTLAPVGSIAVTKATRQLWEGYLTFRSFVEGETGLWRSFSRQIPRNRNGCVLTMTMASTTDGNSRESQTKIRRSMFRKRSRFETCGSTSATAGEERGSPPDAWREPQTPNAARAESDLATRTSRVAVTHSPRFVTWTTF